MFDVVGALLATPLFDCPAVIPESPKIYKKKIAIVHGIYYIDI